MTVQMCQSSASLSSGWSSLRTILSTIEGLYEAASAAQTEDTVPRQVRTFFFEFFESDAADRASYLNGAWSIVEELDAIATTGEMPPLSGNWHDALMYYENTWLPMPDRTRAGVQLQLSNMLDPFSLEPFRTLFSGRSDVKMDQALDQGAVVYVHMPVARRETMSKVICTFVKLEFFREVLIRPDKIRPSFFFCDEFQTFFTVGEGRGDAEFFERSRQSLHANVVATQNVEALFKQSPEESPIKNLLANCGSKIFLRNTDERTNQFASQLFGQSLESKIGSSRNAAEGGIFKNPTKSSSSISTTVEYADRIRPEEFSRLVQPSRHESIEHTESIVHLGSRSTIQQLRLQWPLCLFD